MRLEAGQEAKLFVIRDTSGALHRLVDYRGGPLLLSFFRYSSCPFCNLRVHELTLKWEEFSKKGLRILGVFQSDLDSVDKKFKDRDLPFPLVADPKRALYDLYGVESSVGGFLRGAVNPKIFKAMSKGFLPGAMEGDKFSIPADFLIDGNLHIVEAFYGSTIADHMPIQMIAQYLDEQEVPMRAATGVSA